MVNYSPQLVSALETILPTHYELICDSKTVKPCITWQETNNYADVGRDKTVYSWIEYQIKIWAGNRESVAVEKAVLVDEALSELGFERTSTYELLANNEICKIMNYRIHGIEY